MSGTYLYCQNVECRAYLGSLGGDKCHLCGWSNPETSPDDEETQCATQALACDDCGCPETGYCCCPDSPMNTRPGTPERAAAITEYLKGN